MSIILYRKLLGDKHKNCKYSQQKNEDFNFQNILNNRLLDIQNRRYSILTNTEAKNDS